MNRDEALKLVREYTKNENLVKHMIAVGICMRAMAEKMNGDPDKWEVCGIIHDFDYEKMGHEHPSQWGYEQLRAAGADEEMIDAIEGHVNKDAPETRQTDIAKALFACDELSGLIVAAALPRPNQLSDLEASSVMKKFKDKTFARGVNRDDVRVGAAELNMEVPELAAYLIEALRARKDEIGLK